jgi:hypothetical protein
VDHVARVKVLHGLSHLLEPAQQLELRATQDMQAVQCQLLVGVTYLGVRRHSR